MAMQCLARLGQGPHENVSLYSSRKYKASSTASFATGRIGATAQQLVVDIPPTNNVHVYVYTNIVYVNIYSYIHIYIYIYIRCSINIRAYIRSAPKVMHILDALYISMHIFAAR